MTKLSVRIGSEYDRYTECRPSRPVFIRDKQYLLYPTAKGPSTDPPQLQKEAQAQVFEAGRSTNRQLPVSGVLMRRNIILVTIDSLRADHCGFMGYERDTTPTIDALASDGLVFENAIAPSTSTPNSLPPMFTGRYPGTAAGDVSGMVESQELIKSHIQKYETIAERFSKMGYATAGLTPNPWTSRHFGFDAGFDYFNDFLDEDRGSRLFERILEGKGSQRINALRLMLSWLQRENTFKPWESFYDETIGWIEQQEQPYFIWIFLLDPHFPYLPARSFRTQSLWSTIHSNIQLYIQDQDTPYEPKTHRRLVRAYDDAIHYTDEFFNKLIGDLSEDTNIVITADHGEGFGEHGTYGHHNQLYEENIHVPLVISGEEWDGSVQRPVSLVSLPKILHKVATGENRMMKQLGKPIVSISPNNTPAGLRGRKWKYIEDAIESKELYDLHTDSDESENIISRLDDTSPLETRLRQGRSHVKTTGQLSEIAAEVTADSGDLL